MLSRPLSLATVTLLIGCLAAGSAHAQATNLEAGKSPSQIFAGTCSACHKSPRGLLKTVGASSLPGFLRQHYTTSSDMASVLASYLVSNGATDTRYQAKQGKDAARLLGPPDQLDRFGRRIQPAPAQEAARPDTQQRAARPDADGLGPQGEGGHVGRNARRQGRPGEAPDATNPQAATDSKPGTRQKLSKRGRPAEDVAKPDAAKSDAAKPEPAKPDAAKPEDAAKGEVAKEEPSKSDTANIDTGKPEAGKTDVGKGEGDKAEGTRPASEPKPETAKVDAPKENGGSEPTPLRPDPVPPVTAAPATPPVASAATGAAEPAAPSLPPAAASPELPATTAASPPAPAVPANPSAPPMSK